MISFVSNTRRRRNVVFLPLTILLSVLLFASAETTSDKEGRRTAVLFGATGAVGSEAMRSLLLHNIYHGAPFWEEVVLVGRREAPLFQSDSSLLPNITQIIVEDMTVADQNERLKSVKADACIIAVGSSSPMVGTLRTWHDVDVVLPAAVARLCRSMGATYISLLSAVDSEEGGPTPFDEAELAEGDDTTLGWWGMLVRYARVKGLAEQAASSADISNVRIFQPSNIVTHETRYGWFDRILFQILPYINPILPEKYRSVPVRLLGMAMAADAAKKLLDETHADDAVVTKLTRGDFIDIAGNWFHEEEKQLKADVSEEL
mmetsp:Transcript_13436/g.26820  ORF Transcript_13436/g.26820 Transcript_13436/m.26820 type:complete len:318 (+) Transcript_13436:22-975(+)